MTFIGSMLAASLAAWATSGDPQAGSETAAAASPTTPKTELVGEYAFVGGQRQRDLVAQAIERSVQSLPGFHHIARQRLTEANQIPGSVRISMDGADLVVVYGNQSPQRAPLDGTVKPWRNREGKTINLKHELRKGKLVQTTWGDEGRRVMVWSYDPERKLLRVHSTMSSSRLPEPVRYRLSFGRR